MTSLAERDAFTLVQAQAWQARVVPEFEALGFSTRVLKTEHSRGSGHVARCSLKMADRSTRVHVEFTVYVNVMTRPGNKLGHKVYLQALMRTSTTHLGSVSASVLLSGDTPQEWAAQLSRAFFEPDQVMAPASLADLLDRYLTL